MESNVVKWSLHVFLLFGIFGASMCGSDCDSDKNHCESAGLDPSHVRNVAENRLSAQIYAVVDHFQQEDPVGLPGAPVPDPFNVPDVSKPIGMGTLKMKNTKAYGLSKFRIKSFVLDVNELMANVEIQLDVMLVKGNYTLSSFFSSTNGPFTIVLKNIVAKGNTTVGVEKDGKVRTEDIALDFTFSDMTMDFQNLGLMGSIFQSVINNAPNLLFDSMKPFMLKDAYVKLKTEIDTNVEKVMGDKCLPNSISPLDMAIAEGRKKVRDMGYDPFKVRDYNHTVGMFSMQLTNTWISGISSFYRVGDIIVSMKNNTVTMQLHVGTQKLMGSTQWEASAGKGIITRVGGAQFNVQHVKAIFVISQSLDTRKRPEINDIQLELGNIQVRSDGAGTLDYVIEFLVNILPNLLRYQIMDALENPAKARIQAEFNKVDVEKILKQKVAEYERTGGNMTMNLDFNF